MRMEVYLEAFGHWDVVVGSNIQRKKDHQALLVTYGAISKEFLVQVNPKTLAKENSDDFLSFEYWI